MTLHSNDLSALAKSLAKAFPAYDVRMRLAEKAEVASEAQIAGDAVEAWRDIVHCAHTKGSLNVLVASALHEQPNNGALLRFKEESEPEKTSSRAESLGHLWVGMVLLIAGGVAFFVKGSSDSGPVDGTEVEVQTPVHEIVKADEPVEAQFVVPPEGGELENAETEALPVEAVVEPLNQPVGIAQDALDTTEVTGRCGGSPGTLVGYFYAGDSFSGVKGQPHTMTSDVNVRADYPHKSNGWSSGAKIRCVLVRSDVLVLTKNAIKVDGEKYWVPLYAGDLQKR
jgi:hypothetical protein